MKWNDKYSVGIERIDLQHMMLFKMSEDFHTAIDNGQGEEIYQTMLNMIDNYTQDHFGFEEQCMNEYRCPVSKQNKLEHKEFSAVIQRYKQKNKTFGIEKTDAIALLDAIDHWLDSHICKIDVHLKKCVRTREPNSKLS